MNLLIQIAASASRISRPRKLRRQVQRKACSQQVHVVHLKDRRRDVKKRFAGIRALLLYRLHAANEVNFPCKEVMISSEMMN